LIPILRGTVLFIAGSSLSRYAMGAEQPAPREDESADGWNHEVDGSVVVWDLSGMPVAAGREELLPVFQKFGEVALDDAVTASICVLSEEGGISGEAFDLIEENTDLLRQAGLEKIGFVGPHVKGLALKSRLESDAYDVGTFEDVDEAVAWGKG
jgi:hypothetical protein